MKTYHQIELEHFVQYADEELRNAQLQDILSYEKALALQLYLRGQGEKWLIFDLNNNAPMMLLFDENPFRFPKVKKPLGLFLHSHAKNLFLQKIEHRAEWGRVVELFFSGGDKQCSIEVQLIPKAANLIVKTKEKKSEKKISWSKPKALVAVETPDAEEVRSIGLIHKEWLAGIAKPKVGSSDPALQIRKKIEKELEKKKKALAEIQKGLDANEAQDWIEIGQSLKVMPLEDLDRKWDIYLDRKKSRTWNMENAFHKAKSLEKKRQGTLERKKVLQEEINRLESDLEGEVYRRTQSQPKMGLRRKSPQDVKARKKELASGLVAYLGKSASDNLNLLRQSQAWDVWLHLRDYPSAHAIIQRNKNQNIRPDELQEVALWLTQESLQKKLILPGTRLEVVHTECRYVRPIKGDKLGRVNYQNETHFMLVIS